MSSQPQVSQDTPMEFLRDFAGRLAAGKVELPPFPETYLRILRALDDPELTMPKLARLVTAAPDLAVKVLLMANSVMLNRSGVEVTDVNVAVSRLGLATIRNVTVALATRDSFDMPTDAAAKAILEVLRRHSVMTAAFGYALALNTKLRELRDDAMLAGLLHNVGSLYLLSRSGDYPEFREEHVIQTWSPSIGRAIVENWGFPENIAQAIENQDELEHASYGPPDLDDLVMVSKRLALFAEGLPPLEENWEEAPAFVKLQIDSEHLEEVLTELSESVDSFVSALG